MNQLPFVPNQIYNRRNDIHSLYGGNWQSGISNSASKPYIFIFTGSSGHQHGYLDGWDNPNVFSYTGEGQVGDMEFTKGNLALRDHLQNGKRVFLFEQVSKGYVKFLSEVELMEFDFFETRDRLANIRIGIKFFLKRLGAVLPYQASLLNESSLIAADSFEVESWLQTEQQRFVNTRVGQGAYRKRIIHRWESKCAVTHFDNLKVLVASHIVPWAESSDEQRLDVHNGILLSPTYDALFDLNFISFEDSGKIILSESIEPKAFERIGVSGKEKILKLSEPNYPYLDLHRQRLR